MIPKSSYCLIFQLVAHPKYAITTKQCKGKINSCRVDVHLMVEISEMIGGEMCLWRAMLTINPKLKTNFLVSYFLTTLLRFTAYMNVIYSSIYIHFILTSSLNVFGNKIELLLWYFTYRIN